MSISSSACAIVKTTPTTPKKIQIMPIASIQMGESFHSCQDRDAISPINKKKAEVSCFNNKDIGTQNIVGLKTRPPYNTVWQ